ncbi:MAG TPA: GtrA family protein [Sphingomicrobium sp.]|nr:GtrA family protein [Sphingomicrobium sp.]
MLDQTYTRYIGASVASLGVDFAIFMAALSIGLTPALAAAVGYIAGIACHWVISSRMVFVGQVAAVGAARRQQQLLFLLSALVGLGITTGIVGLASRYGLDPRIAKGIAIVVSFQATYVLRKRVVFA